MLSIAIGEQESDVAIESAANTLLRRRFDGICGSTAIIPGKPCVIFGQKSVLSLHL